MARDVTLDEVAHHSGVSRATASRALNGRSGVRDDVRRRVEASASALGYRPNRAARNLAGGRASVIGLLLGASELQTEPYQTAVLREVANAADERDEGLMLLLDTTDPSEAVRRLLGDGLIDGVLVSVTALGSRWVEELLDARVPTVLLGTHPRRTDVTVVEVESRRSSAAIVGHLLDTGCQRVGTITGPMYKSDAVDRLAGFRDAHRERSRKVDDRLIVNGNFSREQGYRLAKDLLDNGVDGIFAANDETAMGVYFQAVERGIDIPGQLCIAGFDGQRTSGTGLLPPSQDPLITSVVQPFGRLAAAAVDALIAEVTGDVPSHTQIIEPAIFYGTTTRSP